MLLDCPARYLVAWGKSFYKLVVGVVSIGFLKNKCFTSREHCKCLTLFNSAFSLVTCGEL